MESESRKNSRKRQYEGNGRMSRQAGTGNAWGQGGVDEKRAQNSRVWSQILSERGWLDMIVK